MIDFDENEVDIPALNVEPPKKEDISPAMQYSKELKEDLNLTRYNLREKALSCSAMKAKWIEYMAKEKEALTKLTSLRKEYTEKVVAKSKGATSFDKLKTMNAEDPTVKKLDSAKKQVELSLEVIAHAIQALTEFGYNIKNSIDIIKLNNS